MVGQILAADRVWDGVAPRATVRCFVRIEDGRIAAVGSASSTAERSRRGSVRTTVRFSTGDADDDAKFTPANGVLTFAPGEKSKNVAVSDVKRRRKTSELEVHLSNATGASIADGSGICEIKKKRKRRR